MFRIFTDTNTVSDTYTYAPKGRDRVEVQKRTYGTQSWGKCPFFSTVLQKGSKQLSALISLLSVFVELGNHHGILKMEAVVYIVCLSEDLCESVYSQPCPIQTGTLVQPR